MPVVGCDCAVCTSGDPRDRRTRHGAILEWDEERRLLVDTPPELRLQLVRAGVGSLGAVWYTHVHADHLHGIDDLRIFSVRNRRDLPIFVPEDAREGILRRFDYIFDVDEVPHPGTSKPGLRPVTIRAHEPVTILGERFHPLPVPHGRITPMGFRVGDLGYITDAKRLPPRTFEALRGVRLLVLNALWFGNPHPTHFNVEEAVEAAEAVGAERTYLTHLTHRTLHSELSARLPEGVRPAYDGLTVSLTPEGITEEAQ